MAYYLGRIQLFLVLVGIDPKRLRFQGVDFLPGNCWLKLLAFSDRYAFLAMSSWASLLGVASAAQPRQELSNGVHGILCRLRTFRTATSLAMVDLGHGHQCIRRPPHHHEYLACVFMGRSTVSLKLQFRHKPSFWGTSRPW